MSKWTPIFEQDGREFVVPYGSMVGNSEAEALEIALGVAFVEGILMDFKPSGRYLELSDDGRVTVTGWPSKLGAWDVVILDKAIAAYKGET